MRLEEDLDITAALIKRKLVLYAPSGSKSLKELYPELRSVPAFGDLSAQEMRFVWFMRCKSSPFDDLEDLEKLDVCIDLSFSNDQQREARRIEYGEGRFSSRIKSAFEKMALFEPSLHIRNRIMCEAMYAKMANNIEAAGTRGDGDPEVAAKYAKMAKDTLSAMREIAEIIENGAFGVSEADEKMAEAEVLAARLRHHHEGRRQ